MTISITPVSKKQSRQVLKLFVLNLLSLVLSSIPAYLAKNPAYIGFMFPISIVISLLQKVFTQDEAAVTAELPPEVMSGVNELLKAEDTVTPNLVAKVIEPTDSPVTNESGQAVLDPNAPR